MALICQPEGSEETFRLPVQGVTKAELMGELAALQALPIYQLALPFSLAAWRQLEYAHNLTGTTLRDSTLTLYVAEAKTRWFVQRFITHTITSMKRDRLFSRSDMKIVTFS